MTSAQRARVEALYRRLLERMRRLSATTSRTTLAAYDGQVQRVASGLSDLRFGTSTLSSGDAQRLGRRVSSALSKLESSLVDAVATSKRTIVEGIVSGHKATGLEVGKVLELPGGGVAVKMGDVTRKAAQGLRQVRGGRTVSGIVGGHVGDVDRAMGQFIRGATGRMPSDRAVRGIQRLLNGQLPFDLGGADPRTANMAASLPNKADRLMSTESWETYRQGQAAALEEAVVEMIAQWLLSDRHAGLKSSPDECDEIAERDVGYGAGWYTPQRWPRVPHPLCECYQGDVRVLGA